MIEKEIAILNPGVHSEGLVSRYYISKISLAICIAFVGAIIMLLTFVNEITNTSINDDCSVKRNKFGEGSISYELIPQNSDYDYGLVNVEVNEMIPDSDELDGIVDELNGVLGEIILNGNTDLNHIDTNMNLVTSVEGYPFYIRWETDNYEVIDERGVISDDFTRISGITTTIRANLSYENIARSIEYVITVYPRNLTYEDKMLLDLQSALRKGNEDNPSMDKMYLPQEVGGVEITWHEKREHKATVLLVLIIILIMGVWKGKDNDLHKQYEKRNQELLDEYGNIICELQMYLSAGLTIRGAIERIDRNYKKNKSNNIQKKAAYEELGICVKRLKDGNSESNCYEQWGIRCGLLNYRKLSSLLIQNLRKGTDGLMETLSNETKVAFEDRKAAIRRRGEEAQTKLLFPMMLMLGVVMIIIMIPAYLSFGI